MENNESVQTIEKVESKQKLIGLDTEAKALLDQNFKKKGFPTRAKYMKNLLERDNA